MEDILDGKLSGVELLVDEALKKERITCYYVDEIASSLKQPEEKIQYFDALLSIEGMALKYRNKFDERVPILLDNLRSDAIIQLKMELEKLRKESHTDKLTGLKNRSYIDKADRKIKERYSVLMMDLDKFKDWNDRYGHDVGDITLKVLSSIIRDSVRKTEGSIESYAARYGGEEFYVELNQADVKDAMMVAERIRTNIEKKGVNLVKKELEENNLMDIYNKLVENEQTMTISIGIAEELQGNKPNEVRRRADIALYHAKYNGRNRVVKYENGMSIAERV